MTFKKNYKVLFHDTDINGNLFPSKIQMYMQETTHEHMNSIGKNTEDMFKNEKVGFWLLRMAICNRKQIHPFDEITVETWPTDDSRGLSFNRSFRITRDSEVMAEGHSVWALMDLDTMRPIKVKDYDIPFDLHPPLKVEAPVHFRIPQSTELSESGTHKISYSDIDYNGHMNNTHYPNMICNQIPDITNQAVKSISISYLNEAAYKENLTLFVGKDADNEKIYYVRSIKEDGKTNIEALVELF